MGAPEHNVPFQMPMIREFVPAKAGPWIYLVIAVTFQLSGGVYAGTMEGMRGATAFMREDIMMGLYANLAGMAVWFPVLFRMKFRFTNRTLLCAAAAGVLLCNLAAPHITFLPLLWAVCFVEGICKIQGTFECMSTIQLWMTPERDFTVFFPFLHIVILGSMQVSGILSAWLMYHLAWSSMNYLVAGMMVIDLLFLVCCTRHTRAVPKFPLYGIDWLGAVLWSAFLLQTAYFFCYGQFHDWLDSPVMKTLVVTAPATLAVCILRMLTVRHPFYEPQMWSYRHLIPVLLLIAAVECILATEHVLEESFKGGIMHYSPLTASVTQWHVLAGSVVGCLFAWWWMHWKRLSYLKLLIVGTGTLACHMISYYFLISHDIHISVLYAPSVLRGFSYAILSATFMVCLEEIMSFRHFFQALSIFNMLHMVVGGVVGSALYSRGLSYFIADNTARYGAAADNVAVSADPAGYAAACGQFMSDITEISIKQLYGMAAYAAVLLCLLFLLYDSPVRRHLKLMPAWRSVRDEIASTFGRHVRSIH